MRPYLNPERIAMILVNNSMAINQLFLAYYSIYTSK